jgi:hypothetical protein
MGFYEDKRDKTVLSALKRRGQAMSLLFHEDTFDEVTGQVTDDPNPTTMSCYGLILSKKRREGSVGAEFESSLARRTTMKIMITATGFKTEPTTAMTLKIGNNEYEILDVMPFNPGGVDVFYDLEVAE